MRRQKQSKEDKEEEKGVTNQCGRGERVVTGKIRSILAQEILLVLSTSLFHYHIHIS